MKEKKANAQCRCGCLAADTMIQLADGTCRRIESIECEERIAAVNPDGSRSLRNVTNVFRGMEDTMIVIDAEQGQSITLTANHPIRTSAGKKLAGELKTGDELSVDGVTCRVTVTESSASSPTEVFNLELQSDEAPTGHWMIANGFIVGDIVMQNHLDCQHLPDHKIIQAMQYFSENLKKM